MLIVSVLKWLPDLISATASNSPSTAMSGIKIRPWSVLSLYFYKLYSTLTILTAQNLVAFALSQAAER